MNDKQKKKRNFRNSKKWKEFRHKKHTEQKGLCYITKKKLLKAANLHHMDLDEKHYEDLSNSDNFVFLNKSMHDVVHDLWRYYKDDPTVIDRLKEILDKMLILNNTN